MAFARVASQDARAQTTNAASITATYPATPTEGNLLIATGLNSGQNVGNTSISQGGWTLLLDKQVTGSNRSMQLFYKFAGAGETTSVSLARSSGTGELRVHIYEYSGGNSADPVRATNFNQTTVDVFTLSTNAVSAIAGDLLFATVGLEGNATGPAWDNSFTLLQEDATNIRLFDAQRIVASDGSYSSNASWTGNDWEATTLIAAFKPGAAAGAGGNPLTLVGVGN